MAKIPTNAASSTQACMPIGFVHIAENVPLTVVRDIKVTTIMANPKTEPSSGRETKLCSELTFLKRSSSINKKTLKKK